ncbi:MAG: gamma-tubulin complex component 3 [Amphiamblys sp. WSBS2006]|nr:MAG: gamma-tubulin complex component 3 [Amphiamblys sp. WSBS2006]
MTSEESVRELVRLFKRRPASTPEEEQRMLSMAKMILESNLHPGIGVNENGELVDAVKKMIYRGGEDVDAVLRFERVVGSFLGNKQIANHWGILYFLYKIASQRNLPSVRAYEAEEQESAPQPPKQHRSGKTASEEETVQEMFYVVQGTSTGLVGLDCAGGKIEVAPGPKPPGLQELVKKMAEYGMMTGQIREYVRRKSALNRNGAVQQALCVEIGRYVQSFCGFISELQHSMEAPTLRAVYVRVYPRVGELQTVHALICRAYELTGGKLLSFLFDFCSRGDLLAQCLVRGIFVGALKKYLSAVWAWIARGELDDHFGEFFVGQNKGAQKWSDKFHVVWEDVPSFISAETAEKILVSGTSRYFCRAAGKEKSAEEEEQPPWIAELRFEFLGIEIESAVKGAFQTASQELRTMLVVDNGLVEHLGAIQKYVLLLAGDFSQALVEHLGESLSRPNAVFFQNDLSGLLESAIQASSAGQERTEITGRLDVCLLEGGVCGWDGMCLQYQLSFPLDVIITARAAQKYQKIFLFLWKIKKAEFVISRTQRALKRSTGHAAGRFLVFELSRIIRSLSTYAFSVLQDEWTGFSECIGQEGCTIGTLVQKHNKYLNTLLTKVVFEDELHGQAMAILDLAEEAERSLGNADQIAQCSSVLSRTVYGLLCMVELRREPCFKMLSTMIDLKDHYAKQELVG